MVIIVLDVSKFDVKTHTAAYGDASIPHMVTFVEITSPSRLKINEYNSIKEGRITVRIIDPLSDVDSQLSEQEIKRLITNEYNVFEGFLKVIEFMDEVLKQEHLGSSDFILWETVDIVRLKETSGLYFSINIVKDDKILLTVTTQDIEIDGDNFPRVLVPVNVMIGRVFNFLPRKSKEVVIKLTKKLVQYLPQSIYYQQTTKSIQSGYKRAFAHIITKIIPQILNDYLEGNVTYTNRQLDTLLTIKKNDLSPSKEWVLVISNIKGNTRVPILINRKVKYVPRILGNEEGVLSMDIIPIREMYTDFIETLKIVSTRIEDEGR